MTELTRRSFLKLSARLSVLMGMGGAAVPRMVEAMEELASGGAPVLWLQGQCCSGCSVSLLDSESLTPFRLLTRHIHLGFHQTLSATTGQQAVDTVNGMIAQGGYLLVVEGSVPAGMPRAALFGEETFSSQLSRAARQARATLAVGTCAAFGGIPAAENNPTGALSVPAFLKSQGIESPLVRVPGCPFHPDWFVGTLVHLLKFGMPPLDDLGRPKAYYSKSMHDQCPRFADYERERFAQTFGEEGCLFKLGCLGPITRTDCNIRPWNGGAGSCIRAGAPCIGCGEKEFAAKAQFPFLTKSRAREGLES